MNRLLRSNLLRALWKSGLGLSLALAVSSASASDVEWHAAARPAASAPAASIGAPVPLPAAQNASGALRPVSFTGTADGSVPVIFRAQMPDSPRMMPVGGGPDDPPAKKNAAPVLPPPKTLLAPPDAFGGCGGAAACGASGCGSADGCGGFGVNDCCGVPRNHWWVRAEYLMWWMKGQALPALVTTGSPADPIPGALGQPGTLVLFGNSTVADDIRSGARFTVGWWCDDEHTLGVELGGFFLAPRSVNFFAGSGGTPALFRPFFNSGFAFNADTGQFVPIAPSEDAEKVAFPGMLAGNVGVRLQSQLWGYEANLRTNLCHGCCEGCGYTVDGYVGFRGLGFDEDLSINENLASLDPRVPGGFIVADSFRTQNRFYGGQIGFDTELRRGRWFLDVNAKVALGNTHENATILGQTATTDGMGGVILSRGGLLALNSNIGHFSRDRFAVLPEVTFSVGYQVTDWMRLSVGYNFLYLSEVARAADQVNRVVNPTGIPLNGGAVQGAAQPGFAFRGTDFYAQGINFGLEFRW